MMDGWDYSKTYVTVCLRAFSSYAEGVAHERHCPICRGEEQEEKDGGATSGDD